MLGPVELWHGGRNHDLGYRKERCVLAVLLWELGHPVAAEAMMGRVWGNGSADRPLSSLYSNVSRLRTRLQRISGDNRDWVPGSGWYKLDARREDVDLYVFRDLRDAAQDAVAAGEDERAFGLLQEAERLWHGTPLAELDGAWVEGVRVSLEEERYEATITQIEAGLRLSRHAGLVGRLVDLAARHPFKEEPTRLLMHALYRGGRGAEALRAFRQFHRNYVDELGVEPSAGLRQLHELMLRGDAALVTGPARAQPAPANNLPRDNPDFTGRTAELETLASWLNSVEAEATVPVIVISGMPGIGKTSLAVRAARVLGERFSEQFFVELRGNSPDGIPAEPAAALGTLLRGLGVSDRVMPASLGDRAALWRSRLAGKRALIVLDDAADTAQIEPLLPSAAGCLVLITARRKMIDVPGMRWLPLDSMPPAEAAALFRRTAGDGRRHADAGVASVLRLCGYVPQEIEMAARELRRHPSWDVSDLAARLEEIQAQDRSVGPAIELSYQHLTTAQQQVLRRVALHPDPAFSPHAAAALAGERSLSDTRRTLDVLLDYHLIREPARDRFAFHDLIRDHVLYLARTRDGEAERKLAMGRLLDYYVGVADRADRAVYPFHRRIAPASVQIPSALTWTVSPPLVTPLDYRRWMEAERPSLLAIARYAAVADQAGHAALLPHILANFLDAWGYWTDAAELHQLAVSAWHALGNAPGEAKALTELSFVLARMGRYGEALDKVTSAVALARAADNPAAEAEALDRMGIVLWKEARYPEALARYDEALTIWRALDDQDGEADTLLYSGIAAWHLSRYPDALHRTGRALGLYRALGNSLGEANALNNLGDLQDDAGHSDQALSSYQHALDMYRDMGDRQGEAIATNNIGNVYRQTGRTDDAVACYRTALEIYRGLGDLRCEADTLNNLGAAYLQRRQHEDALEQYHKALLLAHQIAERFLQAESLSGSGSVHLAAASPSSAAEDYRTAIELSQQIGNRSQEAQALTGLGDALLRTEGMQAAQGCWFNALTIFEDIEKPSAADAVRARLRAAGASTVSRRSPGRIPQAEEDEEQHRAERAPRRRLPRVRRRDA